MKKDYNDLQEKIYTATLKLIQTYGVKGWTMDMVCEEANLAKDTLYRIIKSKNQLVNDVIKTLLEKHTKDINELTQLDKDFFEIFTLLCQKLGDLLNKLGTPQIKSLFREYPNIEVTILQYTNQLDHSIAHYLDNGKTLGFINPDTDVLLVAISARHTIVSLLADSNIDTTNDMINNYLHYLIYGIKQK